MKKFGIIIAFMLIALTLCFCVYAEDGSMSDWAVQYVERAVAAGFVPAELQSNYTSPITRKEFAKLSVLFIEKELGYTHKEFKEIAKGLGEGISFTDTSDDYVLTASKAGIVNGIGDGLFNPDGKITREEAATMLSRLYILYSSQVSYAENAFEDGADISEWALPGVGFCVKYGIMNGVSETLFDPQGLYTREQSLTTFVRLYGVTEWKSFNENAKIKRKESAYANPDNWISIPEITKEADTFYIYPTAFMDFSPDAPRVCKLDYAPMRESAWGIFQLQATAHESATNVFAPYYRQMNMAVVYQVSPSELANVLAGTPKESIFEALDYYFENYNEGRPFILASHSQGSTLMLYVLSEYMKAHPDYYERMIAAYVLGYSVTKQFLDANPHLKFAEGEDDTGVIISWNTEGEGNKNAYNFVVEKGAISINPLNWKRDETYAGKELNLGAIFYNEETEEVYTVPEAADAKVDVERGVVVTHTDALSPLSADSGFGPESYHEGDYGLWYFNIQQNTEKRVAAYLASHKAE
ncbi:MAG: DUF3089 domain-containing protein [Clostridia bacterium]|nr:DUF3089 domain-containing protein [Clostridia bacterium]